ncbi:hypothetical protein ACIBVL_11780 [Streptomyces sp. NPDC049687]|uniref:hypothetical protein n=1 Tax=Streptomyces sp. NPDC049687 TaxID=3365596 RepID=UPI00379C1CD0
MRDTVTGRAAADVGGRVTLRRVAWSARTAGVESYDVGRRIATRDGAGGGAPSHGGAARRPIILASAGLRARNTVR